MNWIAIVKVILELLPAIIAALKAIEEALPESGRGAEKLLLVREIIESTNDDAKKFWPYIEQTVNKVVAFFNRIGIFKTSKAAA